MNYSEIRDLGITEQRFNLGTIYSILSLRVDLLKSYFNIRDASSNAKRIAAAAVNAPESGTRESIISTALADLTSFADPDIQYITCNNDIDFKDIGRRPTVVFLIIPDEKENRHVFASLFITQAYKALVELASGPEGKDGKCPSPVNFIIDEFANMPVIPGMDNKITVARSRGISFMLIIQALSQLNAKYTADVAKIISSNCNMQVFLASNDNETAEYFSKICGEKTIKENNSDINAKIAQMQGLLENLDTITIENLDKIEQLVTDTHKISRNIKELLYGILLLNDDDTSKLLVELLFEEKTFYSIETTEGRTIQAVMSAGATLQFIDPNANDVIENIHKINGLMYDSASISSIYDSVMNLIQKPQEVSVSDTNSETQNAIS